MGIHLEIEIFSQAQKKIPQALELGIFEPKPGVGTMGFGNATRDFEISGYRPSFEFNDFHFS